MTPALLQAAARLRRDDLARSPAYEGPPTAVEFHRGLLARCHQLDVLPGVSDDSLRAVVAVLDDPEPAHGVPSTHLFVHRRREDPGALAWTTRALDRRVPHTAFTPMVMLTADELALRRHFQALGLSMLQVSLSGRVDTAIERLRDHPRPPLPHGVQLRPQQPRDADAVATLKQRTMGDGRFVWFAAGPGYLDLERQRARSDPNGWRWVLEDDQGVAGTCSVSVRRTDPHNHGGSGGIDLVLAPRLQGRHLSWGLYWMMLHTLHSAGLRWIKGTTAQPGVMRVATAMGRVPTAVHLRRGAAFDDAWFCARLPDLPS